MPGHADDGGHDGRVTVGDAEAGHEGAVDLHHVDGEPAQVGERRVPGAEVVEAEAHAGELQLLERLDRGVDVVEQHRLGDLEVQAGGVGAGVRQRPGDPLGQVGLGQLAGREVDRHEDLGADPLPVGELAARLAQQLGAEGADEAGVLGHGDELGGAHAGVRRVDPAGQRLEAEEAAVGQLDDRLVGEPELAPLEAPAQAQLEGAALLDLRAHLDVEDLDAGIGLDGAGHGDTGVGDELVDGLPSPPTSATAMPTAAPMNASSSSMTKARSIDSTTRGGEVGGGGGVGDALDHDDEAVLREAADERVGPDRGHDPAGGLAHEAVTGGVAEGIGDDRDPLEPDEEHGDRAAVHGERAPGRRRGAPRAAPGSGAR